jgi:hypothetical protein
MHKNNPSIYSCYIPESKTAYVGSKDFVSSHCPCNARLIFGWLLKFLDKKKV